MTIDETTTPRRTPSPAAAALARRSGPPVALITGAGSGLGAATAQVLAEAGYRVVAADLDEERASATAKAVEGASREGVALPLSLDVADAESARRGIAATLERFGGLDVLVNNAGVDVTAPFEEMAPEDWNRVIDVNLRGPMLLSQLALPALRASGRGHIVNIASTAAKRAWENAAAYHASKWGLLGFSHALHAECRKQGIRVTAVVTGGMRTPFLFDRFPDLDPELLQEPANVARAILFALTQPEGTVIPEVVVLPMRETSWP